MLEAGATNEFKIVLNNLTAVAGGVLLVRTDISSQFNWANVDGSAVTIGSLDMEGNIFHDSFVGGALADRLSGLAGDDTLKGNGGNDLIEGGDDVDTIDGGEGKIKTIEGGNGSDKLTGGDGNDDIDGGDGVDTAIYSGNRDQYTITEEAPASLRSDGPDGTDTLRAVNYFAVCLLYRHHQKTPGVTLIGTNGIDNLSGGAGGADFIDGNAGNADTVWLRFRR